MASTRLVSLRQRIKDYNDIFITDRDDLDATPEDHIKAVAFRILASAAIEEFVEERCKEAAKVGIDRLKKGLPTTTGRALVVWAVSRNTPGCIPVHSDEVKDYYDELNNFLRTYVSVVSNSHGVNGKDIQNLLNPVGLRRHQVPPGLLDQLQSLADRRDPAVHAVASKATGRIAPSLQSKQINDILTLLEKVDGALDEAVENFPVTESQA